MIDIYETCGYLAAILFASSLIPQLYKSCKSKNLVDISYGWQAIYIIAIILGLIYSIHKDLPPIYLSSSIESPLIIFSKRFSPSPTETTVPFGSSPPNCS